MTQDLLSPYGAPGFQQEMVGPSGAVRTVLGQAANVAAGNAAFVFRPGGAASGNVYNDWATLYAATQLVGSPKTIYFDDSLSAISIPAGAYDFGRFCWWIGLTPGANSASPTNRIDVTCPDGVTLTTPLYAIRDIRLIYSGLGSLMTVPLAVAGQAWKLWFYGFARTLASGAGGSIFKVPAGRVLLVEIVEYGAITVSGGGFFYDVDASGATVVEIDAIATTTLNNVVPANSLKGAAGPTYAFVANRLNQIVLTQGSMPGGVIALTSSANGPTSLGAPVLGYTPGAPANWVAAAPTNLQNAVDRIAAVVSVGGATPIP